MIEYLGRDLLPPSEMTLYFSTPSRIPEELQKAARDKTPLMILGAMWYIMEWSADREDLPGYRYRFLLCLIDYPRNSIIRLDP